MIHRRVVADRNPELHAPGTYQILPADQVAAFAANEFKTPLFRALAAQVGSPVYELLEQLKRHPMAIYRPVNDFERYNFTSWARVFSRRPDTYANSFVHDLYCFHEWTHMATMPYGETDLEAWMEKMTRNEDDASFMSEVWLHFAIPELRKNTFEQEIWVDRFLDNRVKLSKTDESNQAFYARNPQGFRQTIYDYYMDVKHHKHKQGILPGTDEPEKRMVQYVLENRRWCGYYRAHAAKVESHMAGLYRMTQEGLAAETLATVHLSWVQSMTKHGVIFHDQARVFYDDVAAHPFAGVDVSLESQEVQRKLEGFTRRLAEMRDRGLITPTPTLPLQIQCLSSGVTATVYSEPTPEVQAIYDELRIEPGLFHKLYGEPYLRGQDAIHIRFLDAYRNWASSVVTGLAAYQFAYASNGSNEAMKDTFNTIRVRYPNATVGVFTGEYEGATGYVKAAGLPLVEVDRFADPWTALTEKLKPGDFFYISHPSALDGMLWPDYPRLVKLCEDKGIRLMVDLAYVGCVAREYQIDVSSAAIHTVFFSLSKMGMYYQRIGGCFSREDNPLLYGNQWFKNPQSLELGTRYLQRHQVRELAPKYATLQRRIVQHLNRKYGLHLEPCDVYLLAAQMMHDRSELPAEPEEFSVLYRPLGSRGSLRLCLTPLIDVMVK